ncbi:hypothetical protein A2625_06165 [candidate division WOR-1 bacterium RIFCSPHIGHO2_01_FULL_53_15]|uniref:Enolase n=1 Tax=candidate division WOR-1 bacterium RIFCSPHIGHO2_01_FULL_53_15 TaxID=1802564 RepID=A0A1F4Q0X6_UNCSA|nr:MAG: hypothetical protein A2625_06165 [candidate division WOR-1 bacterium RIFCSPHIGHO2_01_FULL_53_15]OGC13828.1 MAG: hypothetical protein A3D23_02055 [candidate division WOR-1 bacterium RIFCSPHIGHO2_02_FULL_53_26]
MSASYRTALAADLAGFRSWQMGSALQRAADLQGVENYSALMNRYAPLSSSFLPGPLQPASGSYLERGWVIANHKLVSFHAAFISSVLSLSDDVQGKLETLKFMFLSTETVVSSAMLYLSWHAGIAIHEMGHYLTAAKLTALNKASQEAADSMKDKGLLSKVGWYSKMFMTIPWGKFEGVKNDGGNYSPDSPYNLAVSAAGPRWSSYLALVALPAATAAISAGLIFGSETATYIGRFLLGPGVVGLLDRLLADPGKLKEFNTREERAKVAAAEATRRAAEMGDLAEELSNIRQTLINSRMVTITLADGSKVSAPWQWRNCAMGGRHTEKEYPESNISMQESMFIPLSAKTYEDAQEMTLKLQTRLKEIIEKSPGGKVMGIGLEGGIAPYLEKEAGDKVPEQRLWRLMKQAILDCGYIPGKDVAIALDPAASELENAYRKQNKMPDSVGRYYFWRGKENISMSRDEMLALYKEAIEKDGVPIISIEDGFGERDHEGWGLLMKEMGDRLFVIGDDLVTTNDAIIEEGARKGLINAVLVKLNQIGTVSEAVLAMLTGMAYGAEMIISHRSKSPNDPFEADVSTAMNAVGQKTGGGANTERLQKYGRVVEILSFAENTGRPLTGSEKQESLRLLQELVNELTGRTDVSVLPEMADRDISELMFRLLAIESVIGTEEPTNAGIPSAKATLLLSRSGGVRFTGSTPLGTSAGETEAIHLVDSIIAPDEVTAKYPDLFNVVPEDKTLRFKKDVRRGYVIAKNDAALLVMFDRAKRYDGKGCLTAAGNIETILAKAFKGKRVSSLGSLAEIDAELLRLEKEQAVARGILAADAPVDDQIHVMQRKGTIGMNAILSMSLALGRALAASQGKELWQLIRESAMDVMAKFVAAHSADPAKKDVRALKAMNIDDLRVLFRETAKRLIAEGKEIHGVLRELLPVYALPEDVRARAIFTDRLVISQLGKLSQRRMAILNKIFEIEGSLVYNVELRNLGEKEVPYLHVRPGSKQGLGSAYVSRADAGFTAASTHKADTIIQSGIWISNLGLDGQSEAFGNRHYVAIPHRTGDKTGEITLLFGRFRKNVSLAERKELFADEIGSVLRFIGDEKIDITDPIMREKIDAALLLIPLHEFFERDKKGLYVKYVKPALTS